MPVSDATAIQTTVLLIFYHCKYCRSDVTAYKQPIFVYVRGLPVACSGSNQSLWGNLRQELLLRSPPHKIRGSLGKKKADLVVSVTAAGRMSVDRLGKRKSSSRFCGDSDTTVSTVWSASRKKLFCVSLQIVTITG